MDIHSIMRLEVKMGVFSIFVGDSLKWESHLCFKAKPFESYQLTFVSQGTLSVLHCSRIIYEIQTLSESISGICRYQLVTIC